VGGASTKLALQFAKLSEEEKEEDEDGHTYIREKKEFWDNFDII